MALYDVLIIGAGGAGLAAAQECLKAKKKFLILEARDVAGGRILSHKVTKDITVDLGGEFIHGRPDEILELLPQLQGKHPYQVTDLHHHFENGKLTKLEDPWAEIVDGLKGVDRGWLRDQSLEEFWNSKVFRSSQAKDLAKSFVEGFDAANASKISAESLADLPKELEGEGSEMGRFVGGYHSVIDILLKGLSGKIRFKTMVEKIEWESGKAIVHTKTGSRRSKIQASKVLITVSVGVLKASRGEKGAIEFEPPLPEKQKALDKMEMGPVVKMILLFDMKFWLKHLNPEPIGFFHFKSGRPFQVFWTFLPLIIPGFTIWAGGSNAEKMADFDKDQIAKTALEEIASVFKVSANELRKNLKGTYHHNWIDDPCARGAYAYLKVGGSKAAEELVKPVQSTLYFAGEALNIDGPLGTLDAAISSGRKVIKEVLKSNKTKA